MLKKKKKNDNNNNNLKNLKERFKQAKKMQLYHKLAVLNYKMQSLLTELDALGYNCKEDSNEC